MNRIKNKKFGRSGGFKKKQKILVNEIFKKPAPVKQNTISVEEDVVFDQIENVNVLCERNSDPDGQDKVPDAESPAEIPDPESPSKIPVTESPVKINILDEDKRNERDFVFDKNKFQSVLAGWAVDNGIKHDQLRGLLKIWNDYVPLPAIPIDPRTLLETPRNIIIKENNYWHRGLKNALQKMLGKIESKVPDDISLKINTDGLTILKSSGVECWPILVEIAELWKISPEVIGIYCGQGKPKNLESYLREFVDELNDLMTNGFNLNGRTLNVKVNCFIADSPARAFLKSRFPFFQHIRKLFRINFFTLI